MGGRVTGVRVTPISGCLVDRGDGLRGRIVSAGSGPGGAADGGGGGGGGGDGRLLVASSVDTAVVGAVSVTDVVASSTSAGLRNTSRTAATTRAAAAVNAAIDAIRACFPRYHGAGGGSKYQEFESNASNAPSGTGSAFGPEALGGLVPRAFVTGFVARCVVRLIRQRRFWRRVDTVRHLGFRRGFRQVAD